MGNTRGGLPALREDPVHPHTHGEHSTPPRPHPRACGSSPHAWGTPGRWLRRPVSSRFIPTRMGNTGDLTESIQDVTVHPHTHGEHGRRIDEGLAKTGSSPHAWGTQRPGGVTNHEKRFIPTRMGNTKARKFGIGRLAVHPHTHGEHHEDWVDADLDIGSSPHAWGTPRQETQARPQHRFIPTRMGNTIQ